MANNTTLNSMTGGDVVSDDQLTTLNGAGIATGEKAQRMKLTYGAPGTGTDVSAVNGLPIQGITAASSSTAWTSATSVNTANTIAIGGMNAVSVTLVPTTTFTGGVLTFEVSPDNTNWVPIAMARVDTFTTESTYTIVASTNRGWTTSVDGFTNFRVRLSTAITGTGTATIIIIPQAFAIEPMVTVGQSTASQLQTTANIADLSTSGSLTATGSVTLPVQGAGSAVIDLSGTWSATVQFEATVDGTNYFNVYGTQITTATMIQPAVSSTTNGRFHLIAAGYSGIRARVSAFTSGTVVIAIRSSISSINNPYPPMGATLTGTGSINQALPMNAAIAFSQNGGFYAADIYAANALNSTGSGIKQVGVVAQFDDVSPTAITENQFGNVRMSATRGLHVAAKTDTIGGATTFTLISAATTNATSVKASAGTVYGIQASNTGAAAAFLKIFNLATAPTVGSSVAAMTLIIPAGGGITVPIAPAGLAFGTGISISITGVATTADTTAVALAQVVANLQYA